MSKSVCFMLLLITISLTIIQSKSTTTPATVDASLRCTCEQIRNQTECKQLGNCSWSSTTNLCSKSLNSLLNWTYCGNIVKPEINCSQTRGCAYVDSICTHFTGCSVYAGATNQECSAISQQCISNGTQCLSPTKCADYDTINLCQHLQPLFGCKWDIKSNTCNAPTCSEAATTNTTDQQCDYFLSGCVTNGNGCSTLPLPKCSEYSIAIKKDCNLYIGSDGYCDADMLTDKQQCTRKNCKSAPQDYSSDEKCNKHQINCITNGKGCHDNPLPRCSEYSGDMAYCVGLRGVDGICGGIEGSKSCILKSCTGASITYNTDDQCGRYMLGCKTTGQGCIQQLGLCSTYAGTSANCNLYIGSDGRCTAQSDGACQARKCSEAPIAYTLDSQCEDYQYGCKSNGKGCVQFLQKCSTYSGNNISCAEYIGSDGRCTGTVNSTVCQPRKCSSADISYTTHKECELYQFGCITNGNGCIEQSTCNNSTSQSICLANKGCSWTSICTSNQQCADFKTASICVLSKTVSNGKCFWNGTICRDLSCLDAPVSFITDKQCQEFLISCVTNGNGCLDKSEKCDKYIGTFQQCKLYTIGCWNYENATPTSKCFDRQCNHNTEAISDLECNSFKLGCKTKGKGCIEQSLPCNFYSGTQDQCHKFIGNNISCWNDLNATEISACRNKTCDDNVTAITNEECSKFMVGCLTKGVGCIDKAEPCLKYKGNQMTCSKFIGNGKPCYNLENAQAEQSCMDKSCDQARSTLSTDSECQQFLQGCITSSIGGCVRYDIPCSQYSGTPQECALFRSNGISCYNRGDCMDRQCSDIVDVTSQIACDSYMIGCIYFGGKCHQKSACNSYPGNSTDDCKQLVDNSDQPCWWLSGGFCVNRNCGHFINPTTESDCSQFMNGCHISFLVGGSICIPQSNCNNYQGTQQQCINIIGSDGKCGSLGGTMTMACQLRTCQNKVNPLSQNDCESYLTGCKLSQPTSGNICITQTNCAGYLGTAAQCKLFVGSDGKCWSIANDISPAQACILRQCDHRNIPTSLPNSQSDCDVHMVGCVYAQQFNQCILPTTCASYVAKAYNCKIFKGTDGLCYSQNTDASAAASCLSRSCSNKLNASSAQDCAAHLVGCTLSQPVSGNICIPQSNCTVYEGTLSLCMVTIGIDGPCWYGDPNPITIQNCIVRTCAHKLTPNNASDCSLFMNGCSISYPTLGNVCITNTICSNYQGTTQQCKLIVGTDGKCWSLQPNGSPATNCIKRECNHMVLAMSNAECIQHNNNCVITYTPTSSSCIQASLCSVYTGNNEQCTKLVGTDGNCWYSQIGFGNCQLRQCGQIVPNSLQDCTNHLSGCTISYQTSGNVCIQLTLCNGYSGNSMQCLSITGTDGPCASSNNNVNQCTLRTCLHNTTAVTDAECQQFLNGCKSNGSGCIIASTRCSSMQGSVGSCLMLVGSTVNSRCKISNTPSQASQCKQRRCTDDVTSTTDSQCKLYFDNCVTNGKGCIDQVQPCTAYNGTQSQCSKFIGNSIKCWNSIDALVTTQCKNKVCSDYSSGSNYTSDEQCQLFLSTCVSNGVSCISKSSPCSAYSGSQSACSKFKGINGTILCWNLQNVVGSCLDKVCTHNTTATTNTECSNFIPSNTGHPNCITNGQGCVSPQVCSLFYGTQEKCQSYTATDGPCQVTSSNGTNMTCTSRNCKDVQLGSDSICKAYHPDCIYSGTGCVNKSTSCDSLTNQSACSNKTSCLWAEQCSSISLDCKSLTVYGASACINYEQLTTLTRCVWKDNQCQLWSCEDQPNTYNTDEECNRLPQAQNKCVTNRSGCVTLGYCKQYLSMSICQNTRSLDVGSACVWDNGCRQRKCEDISTSISQFQCSNYLSECIWNGQSCISKSYKCSQLLTMAACQIDSSSNPCLWVRNTCYQYSQCSDIIWDSHQKCQQLSQYCTTDGYRCIAIAQCSQMKLQASCVVGTDGQCGWILNKCNKFNSCTEFAGTTLQQCQQYHTSCISDGTTCINQNTCGQYTSSIACKSGGTDGKCFWNQQDLQCRIKLCEDATLNDIRVDSPSECSSFLLNQSCTSNGQQCISQMKCSQYSNMISCAQGTDGSCIFEQNQCRLKECSDYQVKSLTLCNTLGKCISDGTQCVAVNICSQYKTKIACNQGGSDGRCAYQRSGDCKVVKQCSDADNDQIACEQMNEYCRYALSSTINNYYVCMQHNCASKAIGNQCQPIKYLNSSLITICIPSLDTCVVGNANQLSSSQCLSGSGYIYSWNPVQSQCSPCNAIQTNQNEKPTSIGEDNFQDLLLVTAYLIILL